MSAPITYTCAKCGGTFETTAEADARAHDEAQRDFGARGDAPGMAVICDDCYQALQAWLRTEGAR